MVSAKAIYSPTWEFSLALYFHATQLAFKTVLCVQGNFFGMFTTDECFCWTIFDTVVVAAGKRKMNQLNGEILPHPSP